MADSESVTYPPLNTLKNVAENVWFVDGPVILFGVRWLKMPFSTRMTIVRLDQDRLFIHSPTPLTRSLRTEIETIGRPHWLIGPNRLHYWWIKEWKDAFPDAAVYLAPRTYEQGAKRISFNFNILDKASGYPWDSFIATLPIEGSYMTEIEFFHRPSRTLILTDLIENFEPQKVHSLLMRLMIRVGGVQSPDGGMPRDMRLTFARTRLRAAVETMINWSPESIILAHGRWFERDGANELRRAFRWVLET